MSTRIANLASEILEFVKASGRVRPADAESLRVEVEFECRERGIDEEDTQDVLDELLLG